MGTRKSLNGRKNIYGTKKSKERREELLGTMSYQTSSKWSPLFWLLIGARKLEPVSPYSLYLGFTLPVVTQSLVNMPQS